MQTNKQKRFATRWRAVVAVGILSALLAPTSGAIFGTDAAILIPVLQKLAGGGAQMNARGAEMVARANVETAKIQTDVLRGSMEEMALQISETGTLNDAYLGRLGFTADDLRAMQQACYRGETAKVADPAQIILGGGGGDGAAVASASTTTYPIQIGRRLAQLGATVRSPAGSDRFQATLFDLPNELKTGDHYADGVALTTEQLNHLGSLSWLIQPSTAAGGTPEDIAADGIRYGLARQILAHWFTGLLPLQTSLNGPGADLTTRYPQAALPVAQGRFGDQDIPTVPAYALLRAEALSPWMGASPTDPQQSYSEYIMLQNQSGVMRESIRLQVIQNRLLYEMLVWLRYNTLLSAEQDLRT